MFVEQPLASLGSASYSVYGLLGYVYSKKEESAATYITQCKNTIDNMALHFTQETFIIGSFTHVKLHTVKLSKV